MCKEKELFRAILRSEKAYTYYKDRKRYHQALHIFKANEIVYEMLVAYSLTCEKKLLDPVFDYIFHLEDWFEQFLQLKASKPALEDSFIFSQLENNISYPKNFKDQIKTKKL